MSFELGARQACDRRHRTMGTVHSGKISHLTWTFTKKYWAVLGCTGLYWAVLGHLRYLLGNVQVKWRILPLCIASTLLDFVLFCSLHFAVCSCTLLVLCHSTSQLTSVPLGELQVLPLDAAGEEEVGLLLLGNVLYGHGGG